MNDKSVKRYSLSKQVSDELESMIARGDYAVGDKIPTEVELMELFHVSRNTVREAIQSLASAELLVVKQGDGTYVKSSNRFDGCMNLKYAEVSFDDIWVARNALEITIAPLAAQRRTEEDLARMEKALALRQQLSNDEKENTMADINFHMTVAESCHNKIVFDLYQSISAFIKSHISARNVETDMDPKVIDNLHEELFLAIKAGDPAKAGICASNILKI